MDNEIRVYKMNDYEWWATKWLAEETNDWYNKNVGDNDIEDVKLCDLDKGGMWYQTNDKSDIEELGDNDEIISFEIVNGQHKRKVQYGDLKREGNDVYKFISFRDAIAKDLDFVEPYCIASTEY